MKNDPVRPYVSEAERPANTPVKVVETDGFRVVAVSVADVAYRLGFPQSHPLAFLRRNAEASDDESVTRAASALSARYRGLAPAARQFEKVNHGHGRNTYSLARA